MSASKDFDTWNREKKRISNTQHETLYHDREIWWLSLGVNVGFEQDGTGKEFQRPVLVIKGFSRHVCWVVPLTTSQKKNPYHVSVGVVDGKSAHAIISQLRLVDTHRFINKVCTLDEELYMDVKNAIRALL